MTIKQDIDKVAREVDNTSFAFEILKDYKKVNRRFFALIVLLILISTSAVLYAFYILNSYQAVDIDQKVDVKDVQTIDNSKVGIE